MIPPNPEMVKLAISTAGRARTIVMVARTVKTERCMMFDLVFKCSLAVC